MEAIYELEGEDQFTKKMEREREIGIWGALEKIWFFLFIFNLLF